METYVLFLCALRKLMYSFIRFKETYVLFYTFTFEKYLVKISFLTFIISFLFLQILKQIMAKEIEPKKNNSNNNNPAKIFVKNLSRKSKMMKNSFTINFVEINFLRICYQYQKPVLPLRS